jgi:uncharacterized membrane protein
MNKQDYRKKKADLRWIKWMKHGEKTGCHQLADRSFFVKGYQMPICARCTGVILGYLMAIPGFVLFGFSKFLSLAGCLIMLMDWLLQALGIKASTNSRRLFTGILGGYAIMTFQLYVIKYILKLIIVHLSQRIRTT